MTQINQNQRRKFLVDLLRKQNIINEIENKIHSISGLATNAALTAIENKIPNISNLVEKITLYHKNY